MHPSTKELQSAIFTNNAIFPIKGTFSSTKELRKCYTFINRCFCTLPLKDYKKELFLQIELFFHLRDGTLPLKITKRLFYKKCYLLSFKGKHPFTKELQKGLFLFKKKCRFPFKGMHPSTKEFQKRVNFTKRAIFHLRDCTLPRKNYKKGYFYKNAS